MPDPNLSSFIWSVADLLRGDYKQSEYGKVILPFTVLRRLDCVLEPTKPFEHANRDGVPVSRTFRNEAFGYRTITVERPERDAEGKTILGIKGKGKGTPAPDASLRDTENVPLSEDVEAYFEREILPHAADAWIDPEKTKPPRPLAEIDAELKGVTDRILTMIAGPTS
jgi:type I restriction enzyme M protein